MEMKLKTDTIQLLVAIYKVTYIFFLNHGSRPTWHHHESTCSTRHYARTYIEQRQMICSDKISTDVSRQNDYIVFYSEGYTQVLRMQNQYKFGMSDSFFSNLRQF